MTMAPKGPLAVLLANYGGPEGPADCEPYLRNIFLDPDLVPIPSLLRPFWAKRAARRRAPELRAIYEAIGRYSPILEQTEAQARALEQELGEGCRCYVGMRYFKPLIADAAKEIAAAGYGRVIHLPLYPQESRTTTGSALGEARRAFAALGWKGEQAEVRSFWERPEYLDAVAEGLRLAIEGSPAGAVVLFSAHGLHLSVARKDPYPRQIEATCRAVCTRVRKNLTVAGSAETLVNAEAALAWQSKAGPMKWLQPPVEEVIETWGQAGRKHLIVVPVAFVSEHSETLYELDVLYGTLARELGMGFTRVPTLQTHPGLISALATSVREACSAKECP